MEFIGSFLNLYSEYSDTDSTCKMIIEKLEYVIKKVDYLFEKDQMKQTPDFIVKNIKSKYKLAVEELENIKKIRKENSLSMKDKLMLNMPGNKTITHARRVIQELCDAYNEVQSHTPPEPEAVFGKKTLPLPASDHSESNNQDRAGSNQPESRSNQEIDEDLEEALMGPTIEENAAIQVSKQQAIEVAVQFEGDAKLIEQLEKVCPDLMRHSQKFEIKFDQKIEVGSSVEMNLFSFGRVYFKKVYEKVQKIFPEVDKISTKNHFDIFLRRTLVKDAETQTIPNSQAPKKQEKEQKQKASQGGDQFFSFPVSEQKNEKVVKELTEVWVKRKAKNIYLADQTGAKWTKLEEESCQFPSGDLIALFLAQGQSQPKFYVRFSYNFQS